MARKAAQAADVAANPSPRPACEHRTAEEANAVDADQKCQSCRTAGRIALWKRWKLLLLLFPGFFTASMDLTVVSTSQPFVAAHFNALNQVSWIGTAFCLTNTSFIPFFGQVADVFGRYLALQFSVIVLSIGAILSAVAPHWVVFILGRAIQGVGSAGMAITSLIILADGVSLKEQAGNTSIFHFLVGLAYATGPIIGGVLTDKSWRYVFVLIASLSGVSIITAVFLRPGLKRGKVSLLTPRPGQTRWQALRAGLGHIDFTGVSLFILSVGLIILGASYGGSLYAWTSPAVLIPLIVGPLLLAAFVLYERLLIPGSFFARRRPGTLPLVPFQLFLDKDVALVCIISAAAGASITACFFFGGVFFTVAEGFDAGKAGLQLIYYTPGIGIGVTIASTTVQWEPRQTIWLFLAGTIAETAGLAALVFAMRARHLVLVNVMMALAGFGTGIRFMPENLHLSAMYRDRIAPIYGLLSVAAPLGGTLGLTVMGSVFQNKIAGVFASAGASTDVSSTSAIAAIADLPVEVREHVRQTVADACAWAIVSILPFMGLSIVAALLLGNVWVSPNRPGAAQDAVAETSGEKSQTEQTVPEVAPVAAVERDERPDILTGFYFLALLRGTISQEKKLGPLEVALDGSDGADQGSVASDSNQSRQASKTHAVVSVAEA